MIIVFILAFLSSTFCYTQANNVDFLKNKLISNLNKVESISADVNLKIDIEYVKMPETKGKFWYKKPNKTKYDFDGFSMLPKQGTGNFLDKIISEEQAAFVFAGIRQRESQLYSIIKILPTKPDADFVLATFWVDTTSYDVDFVEITTKDNGSFEIELDHIKISDISIPKQLIISFKVPKFSLPKTMTGDTATEEDLQNSNKGDTEGKVIITYSSIELNKDIQESVFE